MELDLQINHKKFCFLYVSRNKYNNHHLWLHEIRLPSVQFGHSNNILLLQLQNHNIRQSFQVENNPMILDLLNLKKNEAQSSLNSSKHLQDYHDLSKFLRIMPVGRY